MPVAGTFEAKRGRARELYDEGYSCNAIARELDCSPSTVSRWAKQENLPFDRRQAEMAIRAHTIDLAAERLELAKMMMVNAREALESVDGPYVVYSFGGSENTFNSEELDEAPIEARRSAQVIAGVAFDKATRVVERESGGLEDAQGSLDQLSTLLIAAAGALRSDGETPVDEP